MPSPAALAALFALCTPAAAQSTWYVDANGSAPGSGTAGDPYTSIQYAMDQPTTAAFDSILVAPGTYAESIDYGGKAVILESTHGPMVTTITAPGEIVNACFNGQWAELRGFTIAGGTTGIQVDWQENLRVERCIVRDNTRGLENNYDLLVHRCTIVSNTFGLGHFGGGHGNDAITTVYNTIYWNNAQTFYGWGLDCGGGQFCGDFNNSVDPLFHGANDFHLLPGSPCINTGDPTLTDPDGSRLDIGALPFDANWPLGESYCTPTANSTGGRAVIYVTGTRSLSANDLEFSCVRTPANASGLYFYGTEQGLLPLGDGFVCLGGAIARLPVTPTGPLGVPEFALDVTDLPGHVPAILAGESRYFQYWFRDVAGAGGGFNYSNGVCITFAP